MKGNPKKRRRGGKPPVRGKQLELSGCLAQNEEAQVGASVGSFSEVVVEDASIGAWSDADDEDSCFGACLATDRDYDGPVNCSMAGSGDVPIVDCVFLQHEQTQSSSHNGDAMECESESTDGMDYDGEDLVDTELEGEDEDENVEVDSDDDDDSSGSNYFTFVLSDDCCNNCHRRKFAHAGPEQYQIRLRSCRVQKSSFRRKFANYAWAEVRAAVQANGSAGNGDFLRLTLCQQCGEYLTSERSRNKADIVWPAMIWKWLSTEIAIVQHGSDLWSLIPRDWRPWWLDSVQQLHPKYRRVTLENPPCSFVDVTLKKEEFATAIAAQQAGTLAAACNEHLHATVWCPWGESEYLHHCGFLPLDLIVARLYGDCMRTIKGNVRDDLRKVVGILDNYLDGGFARILENPDWEVRPSIAFENGAPVVLTCRRHRYGCNGRYLHLPRNPRGVLPSIQSDQLTPAVVRPRTLKQLKVHEFLDSYQMREMQGQYNGVDTVQVCDHHDFSSDSKMLRDCEAVRTRNVAARTCLLWMLMKWPIWERKLSKGNSIVVVMSLLIRILCSFDAGCSKSLSCSTLICIVLYE